jgi:hypothetical protein
MSVSAIGMALLAPAVWTSVRSHVSPTIIAIVVIVAIVGTIAVIGWRPPDRPPHVEDKAKRDEVDD